MRRRVEHLITAERHVEGGGFVVRRPFPIAKVDHIDPFLLIDEMGPIEYAPGQAVGAPDHPHRGFETVTYFLESEGQHEDSAGHRGVLRASARSTATARATSSQSVPRRTSCSYTIGGTVEAKDVRAAAVSGVKDSQMQLSTAVMEWRAGSWHELH